MARANMDISVRLSRAFEESYSDRGTGACQDMSWRHRIMEGSDEKRLTCEDYGAEEQHFSSKYHNLQNAHRNPRKPPRGLAAAVRGVDGAALASRDGSCAHGPTRAPKVSGTAISDGCLAKPLYFECVWTDERTKGSRDGPLWRPVPPPEYVALSDMA
ncbi:unnamed protein product, partial [Symbiodinium natans]